MVLAELGSRITGALNKLSSKSFIDEASVKACLQEIAMALLKSDVNVRYVKKLQDNVLTSFKLQENSSINMKKFIQSMVVKELTSLLATEKPPYAPKKGKPNVIMFVGLQGSGKTTTCTKYAYYFKRKGWRTALICADTFRAGAFDQLKQNATKVKVPFYGSYTETDPVQIAYEGVEYFKKEGYEIIIVDTSGRHKQEKELFDEMKEVASAVAPDDIIFTMDSSIGQACFDQASAFKKAVDVGSVIITKLDGHAKGGGALSAVAATESPIIFIGLGEHFDDFESFDPSSFIKRILGMGDISKLFDTVKDVVNMDEQKGVIEDLKSGKFTLRDLQSQFQSILKLGSLSNFMSLIPGVGNSFLSKGDEKESINRIKGFIVILDSLNEDELECKAQMNASRIKRVALGSGKSIREVNEMLEEYKKLEKMVKQVGKMNLGKGNDITNLARNPSQIMKKMQGAIDPSMIAKMGGMSNIMSMMKDMGKMEGMGDIMKQFSKGGKH